jgi:hypothetical protein
MVILIVLGPAPVYVAACGPEAVPNLDFRLIRAILRATAIESVNCVTQ